MIPQFLDDFYISQLLSMPVLSAIYDELYEIPE